MQRHLWTLLLSLLLVGHSLTVMARPGEWSPSIALEGMPALSGDGRLPYASVEGRVGGLLRLGAVGSFDRLNPFMLGGRGPKGMMELVLEPLALASLSEPMTLYGMLAEAMLMAKDGRSMSFRLHPKARFSNGQPVTAEDVRKSFDWLLSPQASPFWRHYWAAVERVVVVDPLTVRFDFKSPNPELGFLVAGLPIFQVDQWSADHPLVGSGPYRVDSWGRGASVRYTRVPDYWGQGQLPRRGQSYFDAVEVRYARDPSTLSQWADAGRIDVWMPLDSDRLDRLPAAMSLLRLPNTNPNGMLGLFFNLRKPELKDPRVRQALSTLLDFEWINRQIFQGERVRSRSFFSNTDLAAQGVMNAAELALAETVYRQAGQALPASISENLDGPLPQPDEARRQAVQLLEAAGWRWTQGRIHPPGMQSFQIEVALHDHSLAGPLLIWQNALRRLGVSVLLLREDPVAHRRRLFEGRFHLVSQLQLSSTHPGPELRARFSSQAAAQMGTDAVTGLADPAVDALIERVISARSPADRRVAARVLDRVLQRQVLVIGLWHNSHHRILIRRGLERPPVLPAIMDPETWLLTSAWWGSSH